MQTHAWVLPRPDAQGRRFAVGWNGLVYPVISVGAAADVRADILAALDSEEKWRAKRLSERAKDMPLEWAKELTAEWWRAKSEQQMLSPDSITCLKAPLLLRLGEGDLAGRVCHLWRDGLVIANVLKPVAASPYLMMRNDWLWSLFDRSLCAFMRADDALALVGARQLAALRVAAEVRGEELLAGMSDGPSFLDSVPPLLADLQRRRAEPAPGYWAPPAGPGVPRPRCLREGGGRLACRAGCSTRPGRPHRRPDRAAGPGCRSAGLPAWGRGSPG